MIRKYSVLWDISGCLSETPDKESFSCVAKFYKIDGEILEAEQKITRVFVLCTDKAI